MNARELITEAAELISQEKFADAERLLMNAKNETEHGGEPQERLLIISELIELYCISEPKNLSQAENLSLEREALRGDASSRLQTAMLFYYSLHSDARTVPKAREAIDIGREHGDFSTVYTSLSLLGQSLLRLGRVPEAIAALDEIEAMVLTDRRLSVGDETAFLEALQERHLEGARIARIATILAPNCLDKAFKKRLESLISP